MLAESETDGKVDEKNNEHIQGTNSCKYIAGIMFGTITESDSIHQIGTARKHRRGYSQRNRRVMIGLQR